MAVGIKKLRRIQIGREATMGTKVDASDTWRGTGTIEDITPVIFPDEDIGYLPATTRSYIPSKMAKLTMEETPATFQQFLHVCEAGIKTATSSADGGTTGYIYEYPFSSTAENTIKTYTIEGGDNIEEEEFGYGFVEHFSLSGVPGEAVMLSADWVGDQVSTGSFTSTATCSLPTIEEILFSKGKLYIDDDSGTMGATQIESTLLEMNLDVITGWTPVTTADGNLYFTFIKNAGPELTLDLTLEHNATSLVEKDDWKIQQGKLIRLVFEGTAYTAGTSFSKETMRINLAGKFESFEKIGERDGNDILTGKFKVAYSPTADYYAQIDVIVSQAAVA